MKILIIPEITDPILMKDEVFRIEEGITKIRPNLSIANLMAFSIFSKEPKYSTMEYLVAGYQVLSELEHFKAFDIYIGYLDKDDFPRVDAIVFTSPAAKEIYEMRISDQLLPQGEVVVVQGDNTVENEVYKRTIIRNISQRA